MVTVNLNIGPVHFPDATEEQVEALTNLGLAPFSEVPDGC